MSESFVVLYEATSPKTGEFSVLEFKGHKSTEEGLTIETGESLGFYGDFQEMVTGLKRLDLVEEVEVPCEHKYVFLRHDEKQSPNYCHGKLEYDLFFCERCLNYREVPILEKVPSRQKFGYDVVRRY